MRCTVGQVVTINDLPDDVLLRIFDFYVVEYQYPGFIDFGTKMEIESWQSLVHVCRRWRYLLFASPRRLNLRLCTSTTASLDVWPPLPLLVQGGVSGSSADNVVAELEHSDRIRQIQIKLDGCTTWEIENTFGQQCRCHSRNSQVWTSLLMTCQTCPFFPIHSWVDLRHICDTSPCFPFHFQECRNYLYLLLISSAFPL